MDLPDGKRTFDRTDFLGHFDLGEPDLPFMGFEIKDHPDFMEMVENLIKKTEEVEAKLRARNQSE